MQKIDSIGDISSPGSKSVIVMGLFPVSSRQSRAVGGLCQEVGKTGGGVT